MITRGPASKSVELNIVGSSSFGRYPKISTEKTYNMFQSDTFMVPYAGYQIAIAANKFGRRGTIGRAIFTSTKFNKLVVVIDNNVYLVAPHFNQQQNRVDFYNSTFIGQIKTSSGVVYITENNKPQILISDNQNLYVYDPTNNALVQEVPFLDFVPGYITFHDTYFIAAAINTNTWRLSMQNEGYINVADPTKTAWPSTASFVGSLQTKPDNVQAVVRFPSKGNMILVMGKVVTEAWFDTGQQLFPYQRQSQFNVDYGCLSPATVAYMDTVVVWLAQNEKSGPIIMYSDGGMPKKITTDGIDYKLASLQFPEDSQAFIYRQDGHMFYHINFYSDNLSLFYDFTTEKFYHASDQNLDYFIAAEIAFYGNQYYFVSKNTGNLYAFDTTFDTYEDVPDPLSDVPIKYEVPRSRTCKNVRLPGQDYFIVNDVGFTIESGETEYDQQFTGPIFLITQDGRQLVDQDNGTPLFVMQNNPYMIAQDQIYLKPQQGDGTGGNPLIAQQQGELDLLTGATPCVDFSISYDGGASFSAEYRYTLPPIGVRKNRLNWWQGGIGNDVVCHFKFWSIGRAVITDGEVNIRS